MTSAFPEVRRQHYRSLRRR